jgi:hypothetical protein
MGMLCDDPFFFFFIQNGIILVAWRILISEYQPNTSLNILIIYHR